MKMMTSLKMVLMCTCLIIIASCMINGDLVGAAKVFKVGDDIGWQEPAAGDNNITATTTQFYTIWASRNRFQVGDSLSFDYMNDSVVEVEKWGYYHCNSSRPIVAYNNGHSVFNLDRPGPFYFISGNPNHCKNGQRLVVEVMGEHHHGHHGSPPSIANPPDDHDSYFLAPSPHPSSATALISSVSVVLVIATLVPLLCMVPLLWDAE